MNHLVRSAFAASVLVGACLLACSGSSGSSDVTSSGGTSGGPAPTSGCTTTIASIQEKIFAPTCGVSGCHSGSRPASGLDLASPGVEGRLVGVPSSCPDKPLVSPGNAQASALVDKLTNASPACGGDQMPPGSPLGQGDITCITGWISSLTPGTGGGIDAGPSITCGTDETPCGATCVKTKTDANNCGGCGTVCSGAAKFCVDGACSSTCPTTECSGACVDTKTDSENCGGCGNTCTGGKVCVNGACSCGSTPVTLSQLQAATFTPSCTGGGCHSKVGKKEAAEGLDLSSAALAFQTLVGKTSSSCGGKTRVVPSDVANSYLVNKLTGVGLCNGSKMPKGAALAAVEIDNVRNWICNGAKND